MHAGQAGDAGMAFLGIGQLGIDFVADHDEVVFHKHVAQALQQRAIQHRAGGVVGIGQNHGLGAGRHGGGQRFGHQGKAVLLAGGHGHGHAARKHHARRVADVAGFGDEHLVAGVHQHAQAKVNTFAGPDRHQNFLLGVVGQVVAVLHIAGDFLAQAERAPVARVGGFAVQEAVDGRVADMVGRDEVRLAHAQRDRAGHGGGHVEELADAALGHRQNGLVQVTRRFEAHAVTTSLLSPSLPSKMTPSLL